MAQIATTIEQSKHLLELGLVPKSADMCLCKTAQDTWILCAYVPSEYDAHTVPAWSLTALLEVMPKEETPYIMYLNEPPFDEEYRWQCGLFDFIGSPGSSPIEAAFQMVCWLLENGFIKKGANND